MMDWGIPELEFYTCEATVISVENSTHVTSISGAHEAGKTDSDVNGFEIRNHRILSTIPSGIENFFVNLEVFKHQSRLQQASNS